MICPVRHWSVWSISYFIQLILIKKRSGRIINVSSVVGITGNAGQTNYSASKAGVIGFTKSLAKEVASRNILVNAIAPGFIATDMTSVLSDAVKENINSQIPLNRMGSPKEIAKVVKFLASEDSYKYRRWNGYVSLFRVKISRLSRKDE